MTRPRRRSVLFALVALAIGGTACGTTASSSEPPEAAASASGPNGPGGSTTSTTTTTTTLPPTVGIPGTRPLGSLQALGSFQRVAVEPPPRGAVTATASTTGAPPSTEKITFRRFGSGPDLLLIDGEHSTMTSWDPKFLIDLAAHYRVTIFDPPGIGYSATGLAIPSIRSYTDAAAGLSNTIGLVNPIAIGWGLGGGVALSIAERHPGLLAGVVLLNSTVGAPGETITPRAAAVLGSTGDTPTLLSRLYFPPADEAARLGWLERISEVSPDTLVAAGVGEEAEVEHRAESDRSLVSGLKSLIVPVLVVASSDDAVSPASEGRVIANELPHATYVSIPGGYATFSVSEPEVLAAVSSFASATLAGLGV